MELAPTRTILPGGVLTSEQIAAFPAVCVLSTDASGKTVGEWAPPEYLEIGKIKQSLEIVPASRLTGVEIHDTLGCAVMTVLAQGTELLVSRPPIDHSIVLGVIASFDDKREFYERRLSLLKSYNILGEDDADKYQFILMEIADRLRRTIVEHQLLPKKAKNKAGKEIAPKERSWSEEYIPKKYSAAEINQKLREEFQKHFRGLRYNVFTPLPPYGPNKANAFIEIVLLLFEVFTRLGKPDMVKRARKYYEDNGTMKYLKEVTSKNISLSQCVNLAIGSPDLAIIIPELNALKEQLDRDGSKAIQVEAIEPSAVPEKVMVVKILGSSIERGIEYLMHEEVRDAMIGSTKITWDSPYILSFFDYKRLVKPDYNPQGPQNALDAADYYSGGLISQLDLSRSYVTGSMIPAVLGEYVITKTTNTPYGAKNVANTVYELNQAAAIDLLYPATYSVPDNPELYQEIVAKAVGLVLPYEEKYTPYFETLGDKVTLSNDDGQAVQLTIVSGADIDIAVDVSDIPDKVAANKEFERIVAQHLQVIQANYPEVVVNAIPRVNGVTYEISGAPRMIQIYPCTIAQILTHHVSMVRGCLAGNGPARNFYTSATCTESLLTKRNQNYYYFAGKNSPMEIIMKYKQRQFQFPLSDQIQNLLDQYVEQTPKWQFETHFDKHGKTLKNCHTAPAIFAYGNFDVYQIYNQKALLDLINGEVTEDDRPLLEAMVPDYQHPKMIVQAVEEEPKKPKKAGIPASFSPLTGMSEIERKRYEEEPSGKTMGGRKPLEEEEEEEEK